MVSNEVFHNLTTNEHCIHMLVLALFLVLLMLCTKNLVNVIQWFGHLVCLCINVFCCDLISLYLSATALSSAFSLSTAFWLHVSKSSLFVYCTIGYMSELSLFCLLGPWLIVSLAGLVRLLSVFSPLDVL